jgi:arsenate reductase (glutaredoxin)
MPAPLGRTPTKRMPDIQVFGVEKDPSTRAAQRFFRERRIVVSFVDLRKRRIAPAELRRFVERLGAVALIDETSKAYRDAGLGYMRMGEAEIVERLLADPALLRLPLVRNGNEVTAGTAEATWTAWLRAKPADGR